MLTHFWMRGELARVLAASWTPNNDDGGLNLTHSQSGRPADFLVCHITFHQNLS